MEQNNLFTEDCSKAIHEAFNFAKKNKHEFVTIDTLMLFLAQTPKGRDLYEAMALDLQNYLTTTAEYLEDNIPKQHSGDVPQWTIPLRELCDHAVILQRASGNKPKVDEGYMYVALFELNKSESYTRNYLDFNGVTRFDIMSYVAHNKRKDKSADKTQKEEDKSALGKYAINLNQKSKNGKIDKIIGRQSEIERTIEILCQRRKNNPILVGEPGVGKTAIAEGLAKRIADGEVPEQIKQFTIYNLDMPAVLAGTKYRGEFEERLKLIIKEASEDTNIVLVIDEIHTLIGTGSGTGTMDASNILKPALSSGEIKVIGCTTYDEYRKYFEKEGALSRRFQKVDILEPSTKEAIEILNGVKEEYEEFHGVTYTEGALETAVELSVKYMNDRRLPDKAFDIIDTAGSKVKLNGEKKTIDANKIKEIVASMARIPVDTVKETEKHKLKTLEPTLKSLIFGQDDAISKTVDSILYSRADLMHRDKPIGSFLFAGPSGVGKTELAKQLAKNLGVSFIRFDMSEYMEKHAVSRLVGAPPGYVGYEQGGQLTEAIRKNPHCVLLLDEIEKAHHDVYNILLQVMDYATLTDNDGKKADFKNVVLIMTTNLGAQEINKSKIGFTQHDSVNKDRENQVKKSFSPEFYNRLDALIQFNSLNHADVIKIIQKQTSKLTEALLEKKVVSIFTEEALEYIAKKAFDTKLGARPLERYIEKNVAQLLAKEVLFGKLEKGGEVKITVKNDSLSIEFLHSYAKDDKNYEAVEVTDPTLILPKKRTRAKKKID